VGMVICFLVSNQQWASWEQELWFSTLNFLKAGHEISANSRWVQF
jgi:hypothetical protein